MVSRPKTQPDAWTIVGKGSANEIRHYILTAFHIGWANTIASVSVNKPATYSDIQYGAVITRSIFPKTITMYTRELTSESETWSVFCDWFMFCFSQCSAVCNIIPCSAFIKPDQPDPWIKDQIKPFSYQQALPHDTKFRNCRGKIVDCRAFPSWSLIHGSSWSGLIKAGSCHIIIITLWHPVVIIARGFIKTQWQYNHKRNVS